MTNEAKAAYFKTLELAKVYGKYEFVCPALDCKDCPFSVRKCVESFEEKTAEEWIAWAEEEQ